LSPLKSCSRRLLRPAEALLEGKLAGVSNFQTLRRYWCPSVARIFLTKFLFHQSWKCDRIGCDCDSQCFWGPCCPASQPKSRLDSNLMTRQPNLRSPRIRPQFQRSLYFSEKRIEEAVAEVARGAAKICTSCSTDKRLLMHLESYLLIPSAVSASTPIPHPCPSLLQQRQREEDCSMHVVVDGSMWNKASKGGR